MRDYKDIENEAQAKYPATESMQLISIDTNKWDEMLDKQSAHISAATAERERMSRCMEWCSSERWTFNDGKWFNRNNLDIKDHTTAELLELFLTKNPK